MVQLESDSNWLKCGNQRAAVAAALTRPMTSSEIWRAAQKIAPRIQLRDVWFLLRQMQQRGLVTCYNPRELNGKVYYWQKPEVSASSRTCWRRYAYVIRARVRRVLLLELVKHPHQPASQLRRAVNQRTAVSLNAVIRGLHDLQDHKLIERSGEGYKRGQKLYRPTHMGRHIADLLMSANRKT